MDHTIKFGDAVLVCPGPRRNPVYVPWESMSSKKRRK